MWLDTYGIMHNLANKEVALADSPGFIFCFLMYIKYTLL